MNETLDFGFYLQRAAFLVDQISRVALEKNADILLQQFLILDLLSSATESQNQQTLSNKLGITKGAVSKQLDVMEKLGWVKRTTSDHSRREYIILTTTEGSKKLSQARKALTEVGQPIVDGLGAKSFPVLVKKLHELCLLLDPEEKVY